MGRSMSYRKVDADDDTYAPVLELSRILVFGDLHGATECFISSHGADTWAKQSKANEAFTVPPGCKVWFYCFHGYTYQADNIDAQFKRIHGKNFKSLPKQHPIDIQGTTEEEKILGFTAGEKCYNYFLSKSQGRHAADYEEGSASGQSETYEALQKTCRTHGRVVVTIRNRFFSHGITLGEVIGTLQGDGRTRGLTTFHCVFCRGTKAATYL